MADGLRFHTSRGLIPALDLEDVQEALRIVAATTKIPGIAGYKIGLALSLRLGLAGAVRVIRQETDLPLLYDHQKAGPDIPDTAGLLAEIAAQAGVDALILFPLSGLRAVDRYAAESARRGVTPIVGGELPMKECRQRYGGFIVNDALKRITAAALSAGVRHFVLPAGDPRRLAGHLAHLRSLTDRVSLFLPGIGAMGGTIGKSFVLVGDWPAYAIVGRAVVRAADPAEAARRLAAEALEAYGIRH
ncbi:MAG: orotidine 5'-phosphate decarboxylase [Desulfovibrio sp.]|jgi:orotidine-5'-phosphate decarboxylase|nr:orotidine 5'-phosphate decarboxylase [Desulfovibrio sp.]